MREYELMVIHSPDLDTEGREGALQRLRSMLETRGAQLSGIDDWGRRRLAYPIERLRDGYYSIARFKMNPTETEELERGLKLSEQIVRHLLLRRD